MNVDEAADENELVSRWLGRTINSKYVVQSVVGCGGMAVVYAVKHRNGKRFALKMLHRELSLNPFIRQRFVREGYVANRVEHDGAVAVIDDDITEDGSAFLVMELLHGVTLERLWEANGNRLTLECVLPICEQLLDVLAAAHTQSIVHRDLKPANVFITRTGVVKILDFGIARLREGDGSKTESGTTLGTPLFMPPEQASGRSRDIDARTDLWAVGATMFSLLSGEYVHDGENAAQVLIAVATTPARSLAVAAPSVPPAVVAIVDKALAFHNEDRWDSAVAMRAALLAAQNSLGMVVPREYLGQIARATTPGSSNTDIQSTPVTTPAPSGSGGTERLPSPRAHGTDPHARTLDSNGPAAVAYTNTTKRSPVASELTDSVARAMTAPSATPQFRSSSRMIVAVVLVLGVVAAAAVFAMRMDPDAPSGAASTAVSAPPPPTALAPTPSVAAPQLNPTSEPATDALSSTSAHPSSSAPVRPIALPAYKPTHKPPRGSAKPPGAEPSTETAPPAPPTTIATPPTPAPSATTPANGHKPPPALDRTSPFGN